MSNDYYKLCDEINEEYQRKLREEPCHTHHGFLKGTNKVSSQDSENKTDTDVSELTATTNH